MEKHYKPRFSIYISDRLRAEIDRIAASSEPTTASTIRSAIRMMHEQEQRREWLDNPEPIAIIERDGAVTLNHAAEKAQESAKWLEALNSAISEMNEISENLSEAEDKLKLYREVFSDIETSKAVEIEELDQIDRNRKEFARLLSKSFPSISLGFLSIDLNALRKLVSLIYGRRRS